jgi:hypothetical protein
MTYMFEVYYRPPRDPAREKRMTDEVFKHGGRLDCWEDSTGWTSICLTFEFDNETQAHAAVAALLQQGERITMGPRPYGD